MSDPTLLVLSSLANGDKHGYAIMQDVEMFSGIRLGPGTLYGSITRLEQRGWVAPVWAQENAGDGPKSRRQPYTITEAGRTHLQRLLDGLHRVVNTGLNRLQPLSAAAA